MNVARTTRRYSRGLSLVEILVALTISAFILAAVGSVYVGNQSIYRTSESIGRLQDEARVAAAIIRRAIQHAGYFGRLDSAILINGRRNSGSDLADITGDCASGWYIDLDQPLEAPDTGSGNPYAGSCLGGPNPARRFLNGTDILIVRRTDWALANPDNHIGKVFLRADVQHGELYVAGSAGTPPEGYSDPPLGEDRLLITEMFHITPDANVDGDGIPTLRRLYLTDNAGTPRLRSEQIARNVEQFQVQFGEDIDGDSIADRFVDPPDALPGRAVSVRFWLLFRSADRETGFEDTNVYEMGGVQYAPPPETRAFRRLLVTQTVATRNY